MRSLIILRGLVKQSKLSWVKREGLWNFFIDIDCIKRLFYRPDYKGSREFLTRSYDDVVYRVFMQSLCSHLSTGCLVVVDSENESLTTIEDLAIIFGYHVFYHVESTPNDYVGKNRKYCTHQYLVPTRDTLAKQKLEFENWDSSDKTLISTYQDIIHYWGPLCPIKVTGDVLVVGDIHSNYKILTSQCPEPSDYEMTVFLGDYIDGPEVGGSRKMLEMIFQCTNPSILFLEGNHELRLRKWLGSLLMKNKNKKILEDLLKSDINPEFLETTSKEFIGADIIKTLTYLNEKLREFVIYQRGDTTYYLSHAGIRWIDQLSPKFVGNLIYSNKNPNKTDREFSNQYYYDGFVSIHGHCKYPEGLNFSKYNGVYNIDTENDSVVNYLINFKDGGIKTCTLK